MNVKQQSGDRIGLVFIYGAGLNRGIWEQVVEGLENPCLLVDFPLRGGNNETAQGLSLDHYTAYIREQIEEWEVKKFIIVAHSLGGIPALKAAAGLSGRLAGFAAVGAAIPGNGGSFLSILPFPKRLLMSILLRKLGTRPPESAIRSGLCNDLSPEQAAEVVREFVPESVRVYTDRSNADIPPVPKLYIKLLNDRELSKAQQDKMIANFTPEHIASLNTGHLPMLSDPDGLRLALQTFLAKLPLQ
ncbi:alpha/beta fold hydrolase [Paenibacillus sepulcri]